MEQPPQPPQVPFVHLCNALNGHVPSADCWCEPAEIRLVKNKLNITVCVVLHDDYTLKHREVQLAERRAGIPAELHWIDRVMDNAPDYPIDALHDIRGVPRQLPPHQE
jgi:hypothetical protein